MSIQLQHTPHASTARDLPFTGHNQVLLNAQSRHRRYQRSRAVAEFKDAIALLFIASACVSAIYFLSML